MADNIKAPETLLEAVQYFADEDVALAFLANLRWPEGKQTCPACAAEDEHYFLKSRRVWKCRACKKQFSIKVGTIFEDSPIKLSKWLPAMWMLVNCKNGISSHELGRAIGVTQKTAWFMLHRIRLATQAQSFVKLDGEVEVDETFIGGKARFMHKGKRARVINPEKGDMGKVPVIGVLLRGTEAQCSQIRARVIPGVARRHLHPVVRKHVAPGSTLHTDAHPGYTGLEGDYAHAVVDHATEYVRGNVHTNGLENFWSLLKRAVKGTYVSVEPFHLFRYLDEQAFRFNHRKNTDRGRFVNAVQNIFGKRLSYPGLTGASLCRP